MEDRKKGYKILFLIQKYNQIEGASSALLAYIKHCKFITDYKIVCRWKVQDNVGLNICIANSKKELEKEISDTDWDFIHYYKTAGYELFNWARSVVCEKKSQLPIITTVCQRPSYKGLLLSPNEIKYSTKLVMIDKASLNDHLFNFISPYNKEHIYFGTTPEIIAKTEKLSKASCNNGDTIVYGRGSTFSKCPRNMVSVYDQIDISNKKFIIAGIREEDTWLHKETEGRNDIVIYPPQPFDDWLKICNSFDVFLYHIPTTSHSSIDGTLGHAMLLQKPVVYYGSDAPKERIVHGVNGFIANSEEEIIHYTKMLGEDKELRIKIGKKARETTIADFSIMKTIDNYAALFDRIKSGEKPESTKVPFGYYVYFYRYSMKAMLRYVLAGSFVENIWHHFKPVK